MPVAARPVITVSLEYFGYVWAALGMRGESLEVAAGSTVRTLIGLSDARQGGRLRRCCTNGTTRELDRFVVVTLNGRVVGSIASVPETPLSEGDVVALLPPICGGCVGREDRGPCELLEAGA